MNVSWARCKLLCFVFHQSVRKNIYPGSFILLLSAFAIVGHSQTPAIDSIRNVARTHPHDTVAVLAMDELCYQLRFYNQDSAIQYGLRSAALAKGLGFEAGVAQAESDLGVVYYDRSDFAKAEDAWNSSLAIRSKRHDTLKMAGIHLSLGSLKFREGQYEESLRHQLEALDLYGRKKFDDGISRALNNIAAVYEHQGQLDKALEYYQRSYAIKQKANNNYQLGQTQVNIANIFYQKKDYASALRELHQAVERLTGLSYARDYLAIAYNNISDVHREQGRLDSALINTDRALLIRQEIHDYHGIVSSLNSKGTILGHMKRYDLALRFLNQALDSATSRRLPLERQKIYFNLYEVYKAVHRESDAMNSFEKYTAIKDSIFNETGRRNINELQVRYETEVKEKALLEQKVQLQRSNGRTLVLVFALVVLLFVAGIVYQAQRVRRRKIEQEAKFQLQLASAKLETELQQDRLRISRELHDNIGSRLLFISSAADNLSSESAKADEVSAFARNTLYELRRTVWLINRDSVILEELQLKLREYFGFLNQSEGPQVNISSTGDSSILIRSQKAAAVFRIAQEAVTNAVRHGGATLISILMDVSDDNLKLRIDDNGAGFDANIVHAGNGLKNMQAHSAGVKGSLKVRSSAEGTSIEALIPLESAVLRR